MKFFFNLAALVGFFWLGTKAVAFAAQFTALLTLVRIFFG